MYEELRQAQKMAADGNPLFQCLQDNNLTFFPGRVLEYQHQSNSLLYVKREFVIADDNGQELAFMVMYVERPDAIAWATHSEQALRALLFPVPLQRNPTTGAQTPAHNINPQSLAGNVPNEFATIGDYFPRTATDRGNFPSQKMIDALAKVYEDAPEEAKGVISLALDAAADKNPQTRLTFDQCRAVMNQYSKRAIAK